ncbi:hypothetical protein SAMN05421763_11723 [[Luteovulum] sphaeroides subsp. megalophilum]|nr:hypothetical protein SAMN05421763_11723 [[Luteovulum] sphaeroides subsp. megalophilum]
MRKFPFYIKLVQVSKFGAVQCLDFSETLNTFMRHISCNTVTTHNKYIQNKHIACNRRRNGP